MSAEELAKAVNAVENWLYGVWPDLSPAHVRTVLEALRAHPPQPDALPGDLREKVAVTIRRMVAEGNARPLKARSEEAADAILSLIQSERGGA